MFSSSTIESSTSLPTPSAKPPKVKTFSVWPVKKSNVKVAMIERGIAIAMIPVARRLIRKMRITATAKRPPCTASCSSDLFAARMYCDWSKEMASLMLSDTPRKLGIAARTASTTSTVFAPGCFKTRMYTPRSPLIRTISCWSAEESSMVATSDSRTGGPATPPWAIPGRTTTLPSAQAARAQRVPLNFDLDLANFSATNVCAGNAFDTFQLRLDGVVGDIVQLPFVQPFAGNRDRNDRDVGDVEFDDERLLEPGRQGVENLGDALSHIELRVV